MSKESANKIKMHPMVRDLYKRFLIAAPHYPSGVAYVKEKVKEAFMKNKHLPIPCAGDTTSDDSIEFKKAISKGRFWAREIMAVGRLHRYRTLKKRYGKS